MTAIEPSLRPWWVAVRTWPAAVVAGLALAGSVALTVGDVRWLSSDGKRLPLSGQLGLTFMFGILVVSFGAVAQRVVVQRVLPTADIDSARASRRALLIIGASVVLLGLGAIVNLLTP